MSNLLIRLAARLLRPVIEEIERRRITVVEIGVKIPPCPSADLSVEENLALVMRAVEIADRSETLWIGAAKFIEIAEWSVEIMEKPKAHRIGFPDPEGRWLERERVAFKSAVIFHSPEHAAEVCRRLGLYIVSLRQAATA